MAKCHTTDCVATTITNSGEHADDHPHAQARLRADSCWQAGAGHRPACEGDWQGQVAGVSADLREVQAGEAFGVRERTVWVRERTL